uniref:CHCH domain-containing protein n=1 Tax=Graphocephala atropunctata TaxID=36148 RepID=A0A1B6MVF0_9HEMI
MPRRKRPPENRIKERIVPHPVNGSAAPAQMKTAPTQQNMTPAQQQPSFFRRMAAIAGGVAVGSVIGDSVTGMFGGGESEGDAVATVAPTSPQEPTRPQEPTGPCAWEIKQFLQCAEGQSDLTKCKGFNDTLRQCVSNKMGS